jgi:Mrp family chromosome partitioning ATPase
MLTEVNAPVLGLVLNAIDVSAPDYRYYHYGYDTRYGSYYRSGYNYGEHAKDAGNKEED